MPIVFLGFAGWVAALLFFFSMMRYKNDNLQLKKLLVIFEQNRATFRDDIIGETFKLRKESQSQDERILDFLSWKSLLQGEVKQANNKLLESIKASKDLKSKKELAGILYYTLGLNYIITTDFGAAKGALQDALKFNPKDTMSFYMLGFLYGVSSDLSDLNKAVVYYTKYIELSSDSIVSKAAKQRVEELREIISQKTAREPIVKKDINTQK